MSQPEKHELLREILADESLERVRAASLTAGLTAVRRRRQRRATAIGAGCLACALVVFALFERREEIAPAPVAAPPTSRALVPTGPKVKWIDDEQLLARFPDRGVALIGRPGEQKLVFLDSPVRSGSVPAR